MKKPVIILIALIYMLAIVVVGFLGIPARIYNPQTFITDISLVFDDKLTSLPSSENIPYRYKIDAKEAVTFNITAKPVPNNATEKKIIFEKLDDWESDVYTFTTETNEKNGFTIATFNCNPVPTGFKTRCLSLRVRPNVNDGNKSLFYKIDIYLMNI